MSLQGARTTSKALMPSYLLFYYRSQCPQQLRPCCDFSPCSTPLVNTRLLSLIHNAGHQGHISITLFISQAIRPVDWQHWTAHQQDLKCLPCRVPLSCFLNNWCHSRTMTNGKLSPWEGSQPRSCRRSHLRTNPPGFHNPKASRSIQDNSLITPAWLHFINIWY